MTVIPKFMVNVKLLRNTILKLKVYTFLFVCVWIHCHCVRRQNSKDCPNTCGPNCRHLIAWNVCTHTRMQTDCTSYTNDAVIRKQFPHNAFQDQCCVGERKNFWTQGTPLIPVCLSGSCAIPLAAADAYEERIWAWVISQSMSHLSTWLLP